LIELKKRSFADPFFVIIYSYSYSFFIQIREKRKEIESKKQQTSHQQKDTNNIQNVNKDTVASKSNKSIDIINVDIHNRELKKLDKQLLSLVSLNSNKKKNKLRTY
jgi:hypothetical protein